jgi:F-type H+-transporting ATPase subunit epsilon
MAAFRLSLVSPEALLFSGEVDQVDLHGVEGDFGVLAGHAPIVAMLRPGIMTVTARGAQERFVVLGGLAEFSQEQLTILADNAKSIDDFDRIALELQINDMEKNLPQIPAGDELDRAVEQLDHYRSVHRYLGSTTAF